MALHQGPILQHVRREVATETNFGGTVNESTLAHPLIDRFIRKAYSRLVLEFPWTLHLESHEYDLIDSQTFYEIPDSLRAGKIQFVEIQDAVSEDNPRWVKMQEGIRTYEENAHADDYTGMPLRWRIRNQGFEFLPKPDASRYPKYRVTGLFIAQPPRQNGDRMPVDEEAVIGLAVAMMKAHLGSPDAPRAAQDAEVYISRLRPSEGAEGEGFRIGGHFSAKFRHATHRNGGGDSSHTGQDGWWENWTPRLY